MNDKSAWYKEAGLLSAEEWATRVGLVPDPLLRGKVAAIVFYDFFGDQPTVERWPHLDAFVAGYDHQQDSLTPEVVAAALVTVGYPPLVAEDRVSKAKRMIAVRVEGDEEVVFDSTQRGQGEVAILYSIGQQAVEDVKSLMEAGVVLSNGTIRADWPPRNHNGVVGYMGRAEVQELLEFVFEGAFEDLLVDLGVKTSFSDILHGLGFKERRVA
jgi:hypothetical protein